MKKKMTDERLTQLEAWAYKLELPPVGLEEFSYFGTLQELVDEVRRCRGEVNDLLGKLSALDTVELGAFYQRQPKQRQ